MPNVHRTDDNASSMLFLVCGNTPTVGNSGGTKMETNNGLGNFNWSSLDRTNGGTGNVVR